MVHVNKRNLSLVPPIEQDDKSDSNRDPDNTDSGSSVSSGVVFGDATESLEEEERYTVTKFTTPHHTSNAPRKKTSRGATLGMKPKRHGTKSSFKMTASPVVELGALSNI